MIPGVIIVVFLGIILESDGQEMKLASFQLTDGDVLTAASVATSGVIASKDGASVIRCCLKCAENVLCAGIFYDITTKVCKPYLFQNYTSMTISNNENFVKIVPDCENQGHIFNSQHNLCFELFGNVLPWNQSRDACVRVGGQLVSLDTDAKINFMTNFIGSTYPNVTFWHVGASDLKIEGDWMWPNGSPAVGIRTSDNETEREVNDCSALNRYKGDVQEVKCNITRRRICEWSYLIH
ncbi:C-type mannose receptor 2-like [Saccostrea cucullata]|uniref:C-type mannose receptor 2-like n=1 Tax=Saccostrea cuccullata TaxID=36930 RepID=UPI002ED2986C